MKTNPTHQTYGTFEGAYDYFNAKLFADKLPRCLITVQRKKGAYGYFCGERFGKVGSPDDVTDEIAMNPSHFAGRPVRETLSTLAHEMAHLWQHHFGTPPRRCYHNREWAAKMREIGLIPSTTGQVGGKETGQSCSHYIDDGGAFDGACAAWLAKNAATLYQDRATECDDGKKAAAKKAASKTKFTCPGCEANAWGKPDLNLICGECEEPMEPAEVD